MLQPKSVSAVPTNIVNFIVSAIVYCPLIHLISNYILHCSLKLIVSIKTSYVLIVDN